MLARLFYLSLAILPPIFSSDLRTPSHLLVSISHLVDPIFPIRRHLAGTCSRKPFASAILSISSTPSRHILISDVHLAHLICLVAIWKWREKYGCSLSVLCVTSSPDRASPQVSAYYHNVSEVTAALVQYLWWVSGGHGICAHCQSLAGFGTCAACCCQNTALVPTCLLVHTSTLLPS